MKQQSRKEREKGTRQEREKKGREERRRKEKTQISILTVLSMLLLAPVTFRGFCFENPA